MLTAEGGSGGYGGTNWNDKDVRAMWSAIEGHDTDAYFNVVTKGWQATAELIGQHISNVQDYRDNLAVAWPPSKSAASAAYIERLNELLKHLDQTLTATSTNITAVRVVMQDLAVAQIQLKPILEQYEANDKLNLAWQSQQNSPSPTPTPSPSPSGAKPTPPVSSAEQEKLNYQARSIMFNLSSTVMSSHASLQEPKAYMPGSGVDIGDSGEKREDNNGTATLGAPFVSSTGGSSGDSPRSVGSTPNSSHAVSPVSPTATVPGAQHPVVSTPGVNPVVTTPGSGPVLGGVGPGSVLTPPGGVSAPLPGGLPASGALPGVSVGGLPGVVPTSGFLPGGGAIAPGGLVKPGALGAPATRTAMPSGGVIGARPGSGVIGQMPGAGGSPSRLGGSGRVNPVGGVIGQQGSTPGAGANGRTGAAAGGRQGGGVRSGGPQGATRSGSGNMLGQHGRSARRNDDHDEMSHWDPDNPWVTDEGVDPVLMPSAEAGPVDPGPAIGYRR
ncbi:hypothetical protein GCM10010435_18110 [Winogradskya consettensis]|uniref:PPE family domain-containing protein n=1 Tax=Winogradskya consettensis TaxID=113560 RepID=A0A919SVR1_9ACTN|nr:hypothetical protein [Actinoplanes consettensis]GIM78544.1 hypothetical protein Aco04nite_60940 [Actinoplanes consettensis]